MGLGKKNTLARTRCTIVRDGWERRIQPGFHAWLALRYCHFLGILFSAAQESLGGVTTLFMCGLELLRYFFLHDNTVRMGVLYSKDAPTTVFVVSQFRVMYRATRPRGIKRGSGN